MTLIDTDREREIALGQLYEMPRLNEGECYFHTQQLKNLDTQVGDYVQLDMVIENLYKQLLNEYNEYAEINFLPQIPEMTVFSKTSIKCLVKDSFSESFGKFGDKLSKMSGIMEYQEFVPLMLKNLPEEIKEYPEFVKYL